MNELFGKSFSLLVDSLLLFAIKPVNCAERVLQTIELGAKPETLAESYDVWSRLCVDFLDLT